MAEAYIGEIRLVGFNFNMRGWAFCNGAILPISQNTALFSLLGTQYGGNGQTTFALPNLNGRAAMSQGQGPGLSPRVMGQTGGVNTVTLISNQIPVHNHGLLAVADPAESTEPSGKALARGAGLSVYSPGPVTAQLSAAALPPTTGGGLPHENLPPYLGLNYVICLQGIYPSFP